MSPYESKLFSLFSATIEQKRVDNKNRATGQYADLNFYHAAVARENALKEILVEMAEIKEKMDKE